MITITIMDKLGHHHTATAETIEIALQEINERPAIARLGEWIDEDDIVNTHEA